MNINKFSPAAVPVFTQQVVPFIKATIEADERLEDLIRDEENLLAVALIQDNTLVVRYYRFHYFSRINEAIKKLQALNDKYDETRALIFVLYPNGYYPRYNAEPVSEYPINVISEVHPLQLERTLEYKLPQALRNADIELMNPASLINILDTLSGESRAA